MDGDPRNSDQANSGNQPSSDAPAPGQSREQAEDEGAYERTRSSDQQNNPAHILVSLLGKLTPFEGLSLLLNFLLVLLGISYTFYAAKQWEAMRSALRQTDASIQIAIQSLELNRRQTIATEISAKAANVSANAATQSIELGKETLTSSSQSFQIDQRPYLVTEGPAFVDNHRPSPNNTVWVNVSFKNMGKSPAVGVRQFIRAFPVKAQRTNADVSAIVEKEFAKSEPKPTERTHQDVPPNGTFFMTAHDMPVISQSDDSDIRSEKLAIYVVGGVIYSDPFSRRHRTEFCFYFSGGPTDAWHICQDHNTIH